MGWDVRASGKRYYYRNRRLGRRVVREYVGTGEEAERQAGQDARRRAERKAEGERHREGAARLREAEAPLVRLVRCTNLVARATLLLAGYRQHDRGEWRRWRVEAPPEARPGLPADEN